MSDSSFSSLESTLERNFPGLRVLDHDLELSERFSADLVAMEASGRLVLVLLVDAGGDEPVLAALEALSFARHNAGVLAAHFGEPRLRADRPPRVLLVAQSFPAGLAERLSPLAKSSVELYEVRHLKSARGENVFLAPLSGAEVASGSGSESGFLAELPPDQVALARQCLARMARLDDELVLRASSGRLAWSFRGRDLARLDAAGGHLHASVAPSFEARVLRSPAQVELFVDEALARHAEALIEPVLERRAEPGAVPAVTRFPAARPSASASRDAAPRTVPRAGDETPARGSAWSPLGGGLAGDESEALLTPEELRAFQE